jgi:hypothetical protein
MRELEMFLDRRQEEERLSSNPKVGLIALYYKLTAEEVGRPQSLLGKYPCIADGWIKQVGKCFIKPHIFVRIVRFHAKSTQF